MFLLLSYCSSSLNSQHHPYSKKNTSHLHPQPQPDKIRAASLKRNRHNLNTVVSVCLCITTRRRWNIYVIQSCGVARGRYCFYDCLKWPALSRLTTHLVCINHLFSAFMAALFPVLCGIVSTWVRRYIYQNIFKRAGCSCLRRKLYLYIYSVATPIVFRYFVKHFLECRRLYAKVFTSI